MSHADAIIGLYRRHADAWVNKRGTHLLERRWLDRFLAVMPERPHVLDIGCGPGVPIGAYLLERGCAVTGVDAAPEMVAHAQRLLPQGTWRVADMRTLALDARFDGVLAWNSFFHLTQADQRAMFAIFATHAAPGAPLMFTSGPAEGEAIGTFEGEPLHHASLAPDAYRALLDAHGFDVLAHKAEDPDCGRLTIWLARCRVGRA